MNHSKYLLLSCGYLATSLFFACAKQNTDDTAANPNPNPGVGSQTSIFAGGTGSGADSGTGASSTGLTSANPVQGASTTADGTVPVDAAAVELALADPVRACQGSAVEAEAEPAVILFLVDVSGSMKYTSPSTGTASKWEVTRDALKTAVQRLPSTYGVGIKFYPNMDIIADTVNARDPSACVDSSADVALNLATDDQQTKLIGALDAMTPKPAAATPTHDAYKLAAQELANTSLTGRRYIVFITDGQPTQKEGCLGTGIMNYPTPTDPIIASVGDAWTNSEIKTFVVGSPGSEKNEATNADIRDWLSKAARSGQTAADNCKDTAAPYCHFDLSQATDFGQALGDALKKITASVLSCNYGVPTANAGQKLDPTLVNMFFSDGLGNYRLLLPDDLGTCAKGWSYTDSTNSSVQICGDTCKLLQQSSQASLQILFGCQQGQISIQ